MHVTLPFPACLTISKLLVIPKTLGTEWKQSLDLAILFREWVRGKLADVRVMGLARPVTLSFLTAPCVSLWKPHAWSKRTTFPN